MRSFYPLSPSVHCFSEVILKLLMLHGIERSQQGTNSGPEVEFMTTHIELYQPCIVEGRKEGREKEERKGGN